MLAQNIAGADGEELDPEVEHLHACYARLEKMHGKGKMELGSLLELEVQLELESESGPTSPSLTWDNVEASFALAANRHKASCREAHRGLCEELHGGKGGCYESAPAFFAWLRQTIRELPAATRFATVFRFSSPGQLGMPSETLYIYSSDGQQGVYEFSVWIPMEICDGGGPLPLCPIRKTCKTIDVVGDQKWALDLTDNPANRDMPNQLLAGGLAAHLFNAFRIADISNLRCAVLQCHPLGSGKNQVLRLFRSWDACTPRARALAQEARASQMRFGRNLYPEERI